MPDDLLPGSAKSRPRWLLTSVTVVAVALMTAVIGCGSEVKAGTKVSFPPKNLAAFEAFAATGDASRVHPVGTRSVGERSCPETTIYVTVSPALRGWALEADLSAFFVRSGLLNNQCPASVYAYYSRSEYQAYRNDGYTAGSVALTESGVQGNLEVDAGDVTSDMDNIKSEFNFNF